ncbi:collagen binding domain-containing protein [Nocardia sp. NPDC058497]|uniref:MSCRAMM family protein n=1 Tax=Nocardia sp. NPDC058497 TaxID=3346529 RepID=UPI00365FC65A
MSKEQGYGVEDVEISVKTCSGDSLGGVDSVRTGPGGVAQFSSLPLGCYRVALGDLPAAYYAAGPKAVDRTLSGTDLSAEVKFTLASGPNATRMPITLVKKDRVSGELLSGATYSVELCNPTDPNAGQYTITTGADGTAGLELLPTCYKAVELVAPGGYLLDATPVYFEVVHRGAVVTLLDTRIDQPPVTRNPDKRVPVAEIPSGPIERN